MSGPPYKIDLSIRGGKAFKELIPELTDRKFITWAAPRCLQMINEQVEGQGQNSWGSPLPPYSENYKRMKKKYGKWRGRANYTWSGDLWDRVNMNYQKKWEVARLYFKGTHRGA